MEKSNIDLQNLLKEVSEEKINLSVDGNEAAQASWNWTTADTDSNKSWNTTSWNTSW